MLTTLWLECLMQQILFFFIRNKNFLLFTLLFLFSIFLTIQSHSYHKNKFVNSSNYVTGSIYNLKSSITSYFSLKKQNTILIEENNRIRKKLESYKNKFSYYDLDIASINSKYNYHHAKVINNSYSKTKNKLPLLFDKTLFHSSSIWNHICLYISYIIKLFAHIYIYQAIAG